MTKTFLTIAGLAGLGLILMSNNTGVATEAGKDQTGSPFNAAGGQQCNACHTGATFSVTIDHRLKDSTGAIVTEYFANHTYTYEVELTSTGAAAYGYQAVVLTTPGNLNAGTINASSSNVHIKVLSTRRYAEQNLPSATGLFVMTWKAPVFGTGTVKFYTAGNGVNLNALKTGDKAITGTSMTITENTLSSIASTPKTSISIYPNPVSDELTIAPSFNGNAKMVILSMDGRTVLTKQVQFSNGIPYHEDLTGFEHGTYFVTLIDGNGRQLVSSKFIKQ